MKREFWGVEVVSGMEVWIIFDKLQASISASCKPIPVYLYGSLHEWLSINIFKTTFGMLLQHDHILYVISRGSGDANIANPLVTTAAINKHNFLFLIRLDTSPLLNPFTFLYLSQP